MNYFLLEPYHENSQLLVDEGLYEQLDSFYESGVTPPYPINILGTDPSDYLVGAGLPVASQKVAELIGRSFNEEVSMTELHTKLPSAASETGAKFYFLRPEVCMPVLDKENSIFRTILNGRKIVEISSLTLNDEVVNSGAHIIRSKELKSLIFVSEQFVEVMKVNEITGMKFISIEYFEWPLSSKMFDHAV